MDIVLMKNLKLLPTLLLLMVTAVSFAQKGTNMELWPKGAPNSNGDDKDKAELTVYLPDPKKATGRVVVCCPGGGYSIWLWIMRDISGQRSSTIRELPLLC